MNTVFWIRHGENPANLTKEFSHKYVDYPLTPKGIAQARQTAAYFEKKQVEFLYSSPLKRARETADIIGQALRLPVTIIEEFRELNVGALELQPVSTENWRLYMSITHDWSRGKFEAAFPEGENYHQLLARTKRGLNAVLQGKRDARIIIVGHGGMLTATIGDMCPADDRVMIEQTENQNCSISELEFPENRLTATLARWADWSHLTGEAAQVVAGVPRN